MITQNITSNEHLRQRWNAVFMKLRKNQRPSIISRLKNFYLSKLPESRVEKYFKRKQRQDYGAIESRNLNNDGNNGNALMNEEVLRDYGIEFS